MNPHELRGMLEEFSAQERPPIERARKAVAALLDALERGEVRAAEPDGTGWRVNTWVKLGIILGFRIGTDVELHVPPVFRFRDRDTLAVREASFGDTGVRIVPGGTTVRRGAHLAEGVVIMPPAYVNVGAWVGAGTMIDSHALVGSCAQVGSRVHVSAAAQLGGVLEPVGALPVVVEDACFLGGGCGVYEGTRVRRGAVLAPGVILTRAVSLYDLPRDAIHRASADQPLEVPEGAVVVPGSRRATGSAAQRAGVHLYAPVIVKYRDASTDVASALEEALR